MKLIIFSSVQETRKTSITIILKVEDFALKCILCRGSIDFDLDDNNYFYFIIFFITIPVLIFFRILSYGRKEEDLATATKPER